MSALFFLAMCGEYIHIINRTKREFLCNGCLDGGLKPWSYILNIGPLLAFLMVAYSNMDPKARGGRDSREIAWSFDDRFRVYKDRFEGDMGPDPNPEDFGFRGHWEGDEIGIVSDNGCISDYGPYEYVCGTEEGQQHPSEYQNITVPAALEYNAEVSDSPDVEKYTLRPCSHHHDVTSWVFYERVTGSMCDNHVRWLGEHGDEDAKKRMERLDKAHVEAWSKAIDKAFERAGLKPKE